MENEIIFYFLSQLCFKKQKQNKYKYFGFMITGSFAFKSDS